MIDYAHQEEAEGFTITLELLPEHDSPDWGFASEEDRQDTLRRIDQGDLLWFVAKVSAHKAGVELASDYLGGCCYGSVKEFVEGDGYYADMRAAVITEARATIAKLNA